MDAIEHIRVLDTHLITVRLSSALQTGMHDVGPQQQGDLLLTGTNILSSVSSL